MSWELSVTNKGAIMAEHARRSDTHKAPLSGERCRYMEHASGALVTDYLPGAWDAVRPCEADYQELADVTGRAVWTVTKNYEPKQLAGLREMVAELSARAERAEKLEADLLAALVVGLEWSEDGVPDDSDMVSANERSFRELARAAIANAKGGNE